jgi:hypothetical protein
VKKNLKAAITVVMLLVGLAIPAVLAAQEQSTAQRHQKHHRYKFIDLTTSMSFPSPPAHSFGRKER